MFFSIGPRPERRFEIRECGREEWKKFRRYHYLNTNLATACKCYGLYEGESIIGFMGILPQPHRAYKHLRRVSRLVMLPDYQGIGLGKRFLTAIADHYVKSGYDFSIRTSARNLIEGLRRDDGWECHGFGFSVSSSNKNAIDYKRSSLRTKNKTACFFRKRR